MMRPSGHIPNIGRGQRRRRLVMGAVMTVLTAAALAWLVAAGVPRAWRLLVFLPAWVGALDFLQVRAHTCVVLAARGVRNMDRGNERISDPAELTCVRRQARAVHLQSALAALVVTAIAVLV